MCATVGCAQWEGAQPSWTPLGGVWHTCRSKHARMHRASCTCAATHARTHARTRIAHGCLPLCADLTAHRQADDRGAARLRQGARWEEIHPRERRGVLRTPSRAITRRTKHRALGTRRRMPSRVVMAGWKHVGGLSQRLLLCTGPAQGKRGRASRHRHCGWRTSGVPSRSMRHSGVFEAHSACGRRLVLRALWPADPPRSAANGVAAETTPAEAAPASAGTTPTGTSEDEELLKKGARALRDFLRARRSVRTLRKLQDSFELRLAKARYETPSCRTLASVDAAIPAADSERRAGGRAGRRAQALADATGRVEDGKGVHEHACPRDAPRNRRA